MDCRRPRKASVKSAGFALRASVWLRAQEHIDRLALGFVGAQLQAEPAVDHGHDVIGRADIDVIGLRGGAVGCGRHRHAGVAAEDLDEGADVAARQVGDHGEAHAGVDRQGPQQALERFQPARRSTDADDGKFMFRGHVATFRGIPRH